ncbi:cold shock protein 1-like [Beta vulgaris subsp. vulgaris]|uniref:cold shock protein 1-like n=1 Tax=Beta vulgaris subsp. vulgaris TaxID=3555 RepID=UPI0025468CF9|nr:cold shock protein 1-like [Beta vulgaris subsp. vulgaris]
MSVLEYAVKFNELARFAPDLVTTDRQRMNRFEGGLNLDIQVKLAAHMSSSYQELYDRAINVERKTKLQKEVYENGKRKGNSQGGQPSNAFKRQNTGYMGNNNGQKQVPRCNKCNKLGHIARECRWGSDQCYRCGKPGHVIKNCPLGDRGLEMSPTVSQWRSKSYAEFWLWWQHQQQQQQIPSQRTSSSWKSVHDAKRGS